ncbi:MAG: aldo/keto reductase [Anaerolineales bacterium]|nr:aldo/keto reductase [Anaerolineales bacterium]
MEYVNLGKTGLKVSRICLGMMSYGSPEWNAWVLDEEQSRPFIQRALEMGINFFDTANAYSSGVSEEVTGRALKDFTKREEVVIATKVYFPYNDKPNQGGLSRKHIMRAVDDSLRRLGTDYIDLYQIHRWDYDTQIEETLEALHDVIKAGKVRYIGASSMYAWQFTQALYLADLHGWTRFVSMQNQYNLIYREQEREMNPLCIDQGIGLIPWSPLARGFLSGKYKRGEEPASARYDSDRLLSYRYFQDNDFDVVERVVELAERKDISPAQLALAWVLHKPGVTAPIVGATKMNHLEEAVAALDIALDAEDLAYLEEPYRPHPILEHQ